MPGASTGGFSISYGAPSGLSAANAAVAPVQTLSPDASLVARDFSFLKTGAAVGGGHNGIRVFLVVNGTATDLCVISSTTCTDPVDAIAVPAGSTLAIEAEPIAGDSTIAGFDLLFGWHVSS